jgi:hypothetical protein
MFTTRNASPVDGESRENLSLRRELDSLRLDGSNCNEVVKFMLKKPHYQKLAKIQTRGKLWQIEIDGAP